MTLAGVMLKLARTVEHRNVGPAWISSLVHPSSQLTHAIGVGLEVGIILSRTQQAFSQPHILRQFEREGAQATEPVIRRKVARI